MRNKPNPETGRIRPLALHLTRQAPRFAASLLHSCAAVALAVCSITTAAAAVLTGDGATYASSSPYPASSASHSHSTDHAAVGSYSTSEEERGLSKFDVTGLAPVTSATVSFRAAGAPSGFGQITGNFGVRVVGYHGSLGDDIQDYAAPSTGAITTFSTEGLSEGTVFTYNVTELVQAAQLAGTPAFGIRFELTSDPGSYQSWMFDNISLTVNESETPPLSFTLPAVDDAVTATTGTTRLYPLANDGVTGVLTLTEVSEPSVTIDGRALVIPEGYTGSFTYTFTNGSEHGRATVQVIAGTPVAQPRTFSGLLYDGKGNLSGWARATISAKGYASANIRVGTLPTSAKFPFVGEATSGRGNSTLGEVVIKLNPNGTVNLSVGDELGHSGVLRAAPATTPALRYHVALASINTAIPGGGFAIANVKSRGQVSLTGQTPDGRPFTIGSTVADNGTIAFFTAQTKGVRPAALLGGELVPADLPTTDITGEVTWDKPTQVPGTKGQHLDGVQTILVANGSRYEGAALPSGAGELIFSGSSFTGNVTVPATVTAGIPSAASGPLIAWTGVKQVLGKFRLKLLVPGQTKPVMGGGIYLPKSNRAWGYFPGATLGGRIELKVP